MANTMLCRKFIVFPTAQLHCLKFRKSSALDDLMLPAWCFFFFGCNGSSRDPCLFPLWTNRGLCRPANSKGNIWMRTRGGIPGFQCSFPGRGFHTSVGKEFTVSLSRQRDFSASDLCLVTASHASAEIPRLPPRLCQPQATHPPSCSPLTSRGCSLAGPR
jgi:hypothetical protein